ADDAAGEPRGNSPLTTENAGQHDQGQNTDVAASPTRGFELAGLDTSVLMTDVAMAPAVEEPALPLLNAEPLGLLDRAVAFFHTPDRKPTPPVVTQDIDSLLGIPLVQEHGNGADSVAALASNLADGAPGDQLIQRSVKVGSGDTLMKLLLGQAVPRQAAHEAINALRAHYNPRRLKVGQELALLFSAGQNDQGQTISPTFVGLRIDPALDQRVEVSLQDGGGFTAELFERPLQTIDKWAMAPIDGSMMAAGRKAGVPPAVLTELIRAFSYNIDFQRDLQPGDQFILQYDQKVTADGHMVQAGDLRYAALVVGGQRMEVFRYEFEDGKVDFYDRSGKSVRKSLLRTPVEGARISSGYGMRRHPILGYSKMHRGVDFAAPTGTPIYAAGDGVVERVGRYGSYGNYIRLRHAGSMKTAYAHLRRFAKGMAPGTQVRQGQVIGYVGSTGRSTGPHLHYEVIVNGTQTNPMTVSLPAGAPLSGDDLLRFQDMAAAVREEAQAVASRRGFGIQLAQITN
ncbi:MAG: peptidoglycan DD-metalloendopeptidase family protein, partial [Pseudomonadota bacterium]